MEIRTIKEKFNPEIALLVLCCRVFLRTGDIEMLRTFIKENRIDWSRVYDLSKVHRIRPVIFKVLFPVKELVEEKTFLLFRSFCINFSSRVFSRKAESDRIIALLKQHGINARQYKGLEFSKLIYDDISLRESADIDVIIAEEDLTGTMDIMKKEGYEMKMQQFYNRFPAKFLKLNKDVCFDKEGVFGGSFNFEFHLRPTKFRMNMITSFRQLLGNDYLSPQYQYDHNDYYKLMIINNGLSDYYPTLRSLLDLACLKTDERQEMAVPGLKRFDLLRSMISSQLFNLPFTGLHKNDDRSLKNTSTIVLNMLLRRQRTLHSYLIRNTYLGIRFSSGIMDKWNTLWKSVIVVITPDGKDIVAVRLPFYSLYYFTKPFRLIWEACFTA